MPAGSDGVIGMCERVAVFGGELSVASDDIGEVCDALVHEMQAQGGTDVQHQQDVHGCKPGIDPFAAVVFFFIGGRSFWQVIAVGGGTATPEQAQLEIQRPRSGGEVPPGLVAAPGTGPEGPGGAAELERFHGDHVICAPASAQHACP